VPGPLAAQKLGRVYHSDVYQGFRFRYPHEWRVVPPDAETRGLGMVAQLDGRALRVEDDEGEDVSIRPDLLVFVFEEDRSSAASAEGDWPERTDIADVIPRVTWVGRYRGDAPETDESVDVRGVSVRHRRWRAAAAGVELVLDAWTFQLADRDVCLLYRVPEEHARKHLGVFEKTAKTFEEIPRRQALELGREASYEELLAYHSEDAARVPGWRALPTPSQDFILKTSCDNKRFLDEVVLRLERAREVFEEDFPPETPLDGVSIVRVCQDEKEFASYGDTPGGVEGWFSPASGELVLFDNVEEDRNTTYAVMVHEAFHQYCHHLFGEFEAHPWFDEGHGDFYGGMKFTHRRVVVTARMPAKLNRLDVVRELVRRGEHAPIAAHVRADQGRWRRQNELSESGVAAYAQSWSIVYMLREGMAGRVPARVWRDEYGEIIPNYVEALSAGYREACQRLRAELRAEALAIGEEPPSDDERLVSLDLDLETLRSVQGAAIEASWGRIDEERFQRDWLEYVGRHLKD